MSRPLYLQAKTPCYPLDRKLGGPQSRSERGGEEKKMVIFYEEYKLWGCLLCSLLQPPVTSSFSGPNILLNTFAGSVNVEDQVSHPYKTTGTIIVLYVFIFTVLGREGK
jgi:hypothetical protein